MLNRLTRWLQAPPEAKASRAQGAIALYVAGRPVWTPRDYVALAREGFQKNAIVHRAVRLVSEAAASLPLALTGEGRELDSHPLLALLARPNAREGGQRFLESLYGHLMVSGNAYVEAVSLDGAPHELHALRPDRMRVVPGADGWPAAYEYAVGTQSVRFPIRGDEALPPILHLTLFHPADDHYGLSPMEAAATALDNAARPSGALVVGGATLTDAQFDRLKGELEANYQGAGNAGRPLLLEGGLDWRHISTYDAEM